MARLSKEQRKERRKQRRIKKALKSYRFRTLKNFLIWLGGLISSVIITVGVIALCLAVIPISTFTGGEKNDYVSEKVANNTLLNVIMNIQDYDMSDIPIVADSLEKMIKDAGIDEYVEIDTAKMKTLKFDETFTNELKSCVKVVATLESINGLEMLGDIGKLNVFTEWEEIKTSEGEESLMPELDGDGNIAREEGEGGALKANPKMYYYKVENGSEGGAEGYSEGIEGDNAVYERAFDDNGVKVAGYEGGTLYFPAVAKISILDAVQVLGESFGRVQIVNLLENFGAGELTDSMIGKVLSGKRIRDMASINADEILLADVLNYDLENEENNEDSIKQIFDILIQAVESDEDLTPSNVTVGHLTSGFNVNGINLDVVLKEDSNASLYKILRSAIGLGETDAITIGKLSGIKPENIALESVLTRNESNAKLYEILDSAVEPADKEKGITVGDLGSLNPDGIALEVVMKKTENPDLYAILESAVTISNPSKGITIGDLKGLTPNSIALESVLKREQNAKLYEILDLAITVADESKGITIGDLSSLNTDGIALEVVMKKTENPDLYAILESAVTISDPSKGITIGDLKGLTPNSIALESVLKREQNAKLYEILDSVIKKPADEDKGITIGDLSSINADNLNNLSLGVVMPEVDSPDLYKILRDATGIESGDITIADLKNIGSDFNIRISTVMTLEDSLMTMICDAINAYRTSAEYSGDNKGQTVNKETVTIQDLGELKPDYIKLTSVLDCDDNQTLYKILLDSAGIPWTDSNIETQASGLTIKDIKFNIDNVKISSVMTGMNEDTLTLIREAVNEGCKNDENFTTIVDNKDLTIGHLTKIDPQNIKLTSVLDCDDNQTLYKILLDSAGIPWTDSNIETQASGLTIKDIKFNIDNVKISSVMTGMDDGTLTLIREAINANPNTENQIADNSELTIGHIAKLDTKYIKLTSVLPCAGNEMLYKILIESKGETWTDEKDLAEKAAEIIVSDININTENVKILTVMPSMDEGTLNIIRDSVNTANAGKAGFTKLTDNTQLTIGHIADFSIDCIKLTSVIKFEKSDATNVKMWKLLLEGSGKDITGKSDSELEELANTMTVDDLNLNIDQVKLTTVMPYVESDNGVMYDMLSEATNTPIEDLTMATLSGKIDVDKVHLAKVMPSVDSHLKSILADAFNGYYNVHGSMTSDEVFEKITIGDLGENFSVDSIRLETVVENPPEDLVALMEEMMQDDYSNITVSALSTFELTNVSLKTVLGVNEENGSTGNQILDALVAADAKVGGLADKINTLSLYDIYGKKCFVTLADLEERGEDTTQIVDLNYKFKRVDNAFVHITDQEIIDDGIGEDEIYYIHKDDGIWLLLCFEAEGFNDVWVDTDGDGVLDAGETVVSYDEDGRPEKFVISKFNVASLGESKTIKDVLTNARMQQFVDAGIFDAGAVKTDFLKLPLSLIINLPSSLN